jgi:hypothetical protein
MAKKPGMKPSMESDPEADLLASQTWRGEHKRPV